MFSCIELKIKPIEEKNIIKGEIIGVQGKLLVLKENNSYYVNNLSNFQGYILKTGEKEKTNKRQRSLFDF